MNNKEFVFWLRGYFELRMNYESSLTYVQVQIIKDHIELVEDENAYSGSFIIGLKAVFKVYEQLLPTEQPEALSKVITDFVRKSLVKEFEKKTPDRTLPNVVELLDKVYPPRIPNGYVCSPTIFPTLVQENFVGDPLPGQAPTTYCAEQIGHSAKVWSNPGGDVTCSRFDVDAAQIEAFTGSALPPIQKFDGDLEPPFSGGDHLTVGSG